VSVKIGLRIVDEKLGAELRTCCKRDDDYLAPSKPSSDWDDAVAREVLVDALARDAYAILAALDGRTMPFEVTQAATLVAAVVGQDLEQRDDGMFRIARRVTKDRVMSIVDPEARHGHKTAARGFDGYKGHIAIDPDSEIITATTVTAGNVADGSVGGALVADVRVEPPSATEESDIGEIKDGAQQPANQRSAAEVPHDGAADGLVADVQADASATESLDAHVAEIVAAAVADGRVAEGVALVEIYGDSSYGTAQFVETIEGAGAEANVKVQPPSAPEGAFAKDAFDIDLTHNTVRCPAGLLAVIRSSTGADSLRLASFGVRCNNCELRSQCTDGKEGRTIRVHPREATLQRSRNRQRDPAWKARYRATRPVHRRGEALRPLAGGAASLDRGAVREEDAAAG